MPLARLLAACTILTLSVAASQADPPHADLYVAPDGNDDNPGTADAPLATIAPPATCSARGSPPAWTPTCWCSSAAAPIAWNDRWSSARRIPAPSAMPSPTPPAPAKRSS